MQETMQIPETWGRATLSHSATATCCVQMDIFKTQIMKNVKKEDKDLYF